MVTPPPVSKGLPLGLHFAVLPIGPRLSHGQPIRARVIAVKRHEDGHPTTDTRRPTGQDGVARPAPWPGRRSRPEAAPVCLPGSRRAPTVSAASKAPGGGAQSAHCPGRAAHPTGGPRPSCSREGGATQYLPLALVSMPDPSWSRVLRRWIPGGAASSRCFPWLGVQTWGVVSSKPCSVRTTSHEV